MSAQIVVNQATRPAGTAGQARSDGVVSQLVTCSNATAEVSYLWTLVDVPIRSALVRGTTGSAATFTFTPDVKGTYLVSLRVNGSAADADNDTSYVAVRTFGAKTLGWRYNAGGETTEDNETYAGLNFPSNINIRGWSTNEDLMYEEMEASVWETQNGLTSFVGALSRIVFTDPATGRISSTLIPGSPPTGVAGGDLSGTYPNPTVAAIQGRAVVSPLIPSDGQTLVWSAANSRFELGSGGGGGGSLQDAYDLGNTIDVAGSTPVSLTDVDATTGTLLSLTSSAASAATEPLLDLYASAMAWNGTAGIRVRLLTSNPKPGLIIGDLGGEKLSVWPDGLRGPTALLIQPDAEGGYQTRVTGGQGSTGDGVTVGGDGGYLLLDAGRGGLDGGAGPGADGIIRIGKTRGSAIESGLVGGTTWSHVGNFTVTSGVVSVPAGSAGAPSVAVGSADTGIYAIPGASDTIVMVRDGVGVIAGGLNSTGLQVNGVNIITLAPTAITMAVQAREDVGAVGTPSYSFTGRTSSGMYSSAADTVDIAAGGLRVASFYAPAGVNPQLILASGLVTKPILRVGATEAGLYSSGTDFIDVASNGIRAVSMHYLDTRIYYNGTPYISFGPAGMTFFNSSSYSMHAMGTGMGLILGGRRDGTTNIVQNTDPTIRFTQYAGLAFVGASISQKLLLADCVVNQTGTSSFSMLQMDITNTALGSGTQYLVDLKVSGTTVFAVTNGTTSTTRARLLAGPGDATTPGISFLGDSDTGLASIASNALSVVTAGSERWRFNGGDLNAYTAGAYIQSLATNGSLTFSGNITTTTTAAFGYENFNAFTGSSGVQRLATMGVVINQTATAGFSALQINATNTALGSGAQYFVDAQVGGTTVAGITNGNTTALRGRFLAGPGALATPSWSFLADPNTGVWNSTTDTLDLVTNSASRLTISTSAITAKLNLLSSGGVSLGSSGAYWSSAYLGETYVQSGGGIFQWPYAVMAYHTNNTTTNSDPYWIDNGGDGFPITSQTVQYIAGRNTTIGNARLRVYTNTTSGGCIAELFVNGVSTGYKITFGAAATGSFTTGDAPVELNDGDLYGWQLSSSGTGLVSCTLTHDLTATNP